MPLPIFVTAWAAKLGAQLLPLAVVGSLGLAMGAAGAIAWEHKAPFGLGLAQKRDKALARAEAAEGKLKTAKADLGRVVGMTHEWDGAYGRLQNKRAAEGVACAASLAASADFYRGRCDAAFAAGVTAGKVIGGKSNGVSSGPVASGGPDRRPRGDVGAPPVGLRGPVGVRDDFAASWGAVGSGGRPGN